jgi:hypothetical protein
MPDLSYEDAQVVKEGIRALARNEDPIAGFNAIMDVWDAHPGLYEAVHQPDPVTGLTIQNPGPDSGAMTEKYLRNTAAATSDYVRGVRAPKRDPKQAALAANGKWKDRTQKAIQEDRFARGIQSYDAGAAIEAATSDGGAAYAAGIQKRAGKVAAAFSKLAPMLGAVSQTVQQMPQDTDAQREQRMLANLRAMRDVGKRFRGG